MGGQILIPSNMDLQSMGIREILLTSDAFEIVQRFQIVLPGFNSTGNSIHINLPQTAVAMETDFRRTSYAIVDLRKVEWRHQSRHPSRRRRERFRQTIQQETRVTIEDLLRQHVGIELRRGKHRKRTVIHSENWKE